MSGLEDILQFALNEPVSRDDIAEMVGNLFDMELDQLGDTVTLLKMHIETEKILRRLRRKH